MDEAAKQYRMFKKITNGKIKFLNDVDLRSVTKPKKMLRKLILKY